MNTMHSGPISSPQWILSIVQFLWNGVLKVALLIYDEKGRKGKNEINELFE
jgi:hypothetical protein